MADYFLKAPDGSRAYRVGYIVVDQTGGYRVTDAHADGVAAAATPSGVPIDHLETKVEPSEVLVELVLGAVVPATAEDYKTVAKAMIDETW